MNTKMYKRALNEARRMNPDCTDAELEDEGFVDEVLAMMYADMGEAAEMREDTPCLQPEQFMSYHA
jgi:hypothetical protein